MHAHLAQKFRHLPDQFAALVNSLNDEQLTTRYLENEWTAAQNVHHLADSQMALFFRFKCILLEDHPTLQPFDQEEWASTPDSTSSNIADSLAIIRGVHRRWADLIETLDAADWERTGYHPESGELTLLALAEYAAQHGYVHIEQIKKTVAQTG